MEDVLDFVIDNFTSFHSWPFCIDVKSLNRVFSLILSLAISNIDRTLGHIL